MPRLPARAVYDFSDRPRFPNDDHLEWLYREALKWGATPCDFYDTKDWRAGYTFDEDLARELAAGGPPPKTPAAGSSEHAVFSAGLDTRRREVAEAKKPVGRPREHEAGYDRRAAYRARKELKRVSVDVPAAAEQELRDFAAKLRATTPI